MTHPWDERYIYLAIHLVDLYDELVGKYTSPMDPSWDIENPRLPLSVTRIVLPNSLPTWMSRWKLVKGLVSGL